MEASCMPQELVLSPPPAPIETFVVSSEKSSSKDRLDAYDSEMNGEDVLPAQSSLSGFLWKFPSEGTTQEVKVVDGSEASYPRKCSLCLKSWVSDPVNELAHYDVCRPELRCKEKEKQEVEVSRLGPARRVFCEINTEQSTLQWRYDDENSSWSDVVNLSYIREAKILPDLLDTFLIRTFDSRRLVFQVRLENVTDLSSSDTNPSATVWCDLLTQLCGLESIEDTNVSEDDEESKDDNDGKSVLLLSADDAAEIKSLISMGDVVGLERELHLRLPNLETARLQLVDNERNSPLLLALKLCPDDSLPLMIDCAVRSGVDCNLINREMESPLLVAAASGNVHIVRQLLSIDGINASQVCALGATPLHVAANSGCVSIIETLIQHGADPYVVDDKSWTALHYAAACASGVMAVHFLCELVPDIMDSQCTEGNTALHVAAACGYVENVRALLETAATPDIMNAAGQTPYRLALENNKIQCAVALNEYQFHDKESGRPVDNGFGIGEYLATADSTRSSIDDQTYLQSAGQSVIMQSSQPGNDVLSECWIECVTEEGLPYYYNPLSGVSSWFKEPTTTPQVYEPQRQAHNSDSDKPNTTTQNPWLAFESGAEGQQLPLCLIPMVSPLTSLDDPTAAVKLIAQREKARAQRRLRLKALRRRKGE